MCPVVTDLFHFSVSSGLIHGVGVVSAFPCLLAEFHCGHVPHFVCAFIRQGYLCCSHLLAVVNNAAGNLSVQICQ
jgi:hypothetical protein